MSSDDSDRIEAHRRQRHHADRLPQPGQSRTIRGLVTPIPAPTRRTTLAKQSHKPTITMTGIIHTF
jgi:hypothetical protein